MYNVYHGSGGSPRRIVESGEARRDTYRSPTGAEAAPGLLSGALGGLAEPIRQGFSSLLSRMTDELETEDLILLLLLYLMYRESGNSELLIIMGAMFLM